MKNGRFSRKIINGVPKKMVTMRDIAEAAKVDRSTVSAVLNGSKRIRVSKEKRELILDLAEKMNYRPNLIARSLVSRTTRTIGVFLNAPGDRFYSEMLLELQKQIIERNYHCYFALWSELTTLKEAYNWAYGQRMDGIITCHDDVSMIPSEIPAVVFGSRQKLKDCIYIDWNDIYRKILNYLVSLGHRKIAFTGDAVSRPNQYIPLMQEAERAGVDDIICVSGGSNYASSINAANKLLDLPVTERPTAVIACNDISALNFINSALRRGIRVPRDISVIGYDNIEDGMYSSPALTTSSPDLVKLVRNLLDVLFRRMETPDSPLFSQPFSSELIIRESCAELNRD